MVLATRRRSVLVSPSQFVGWIASVRAVFRLATISTPSGLTVKFSTFVTVSGLLVSLFFAALVGIIVRGSRFYQTLMLPHAVAPAVAAVLWIFLFNPGRGLIALFLAGSATTGTTRKAAVRAMFLEVFCLKYGTNQLQLPVLLCRAAIHSPFVDQSRSHRRVQAQFAGFFKIALPLIAPVSFFLLVSDLVYAPSSTPSGDRRRRPAGQFRPPRR